MKYIAGSYFVAEKTCGRCGYDMKDKRRSQGRGPREGEGGRADGRRRAKASAAAESRGRAQHPGSDLANLLGWASVPTGEWKQKADQWPPFARRRVSWVLSVQGKGAWPARSVKFLRSPT